jgi:ribokinase
MRVASIGHLEWIEFARVDHVPAAGEIIHAREVWQDAGGGGAVAAGQLAKLAGGARFYTALGDDELGHRAHDRLAELGVDVQVAWRDEPQRRGFVYLDSAGERTITVIGDRLGPRGDDPLDWGWLEGADAAYFTAGDAESVRCARAAAKLVASARAMEQLTEAGVELDALVASRVDAGERYDRGQLDPEPRLVVRTAGGDGGEWVRGEESGRYDAVALPGPLEDAYGCGDSFVAGLTYGLGAEMELEAVLELGARCGAACLTGRGPYSGQISG